MKPCMAHFSICGLSDGFTKADLRISVKDYRRNKISPGAILRLFLNKVGTSRCDVSARVVAGGMNANCRAGNCAAERGADGAACRPYQEQCPDTPNLSCAAPPVPKLSVKAGHPSSINRKSDYGEMMR
jgi:hypothetical protein